MMTAADIYWPWVGFAVAGLAALPVLHFLFLRRWSWLALLVALANLVIVLINGAAPVRGAIDPDYVGYGYGFLHADKGIEVALVAGGVVLASALSAWLAVRNRPGPLMLIVAAVAAFHVVNAGFPLLDGILADPQAVTIQFGQYLTVPYMAAIPAIIVLMVLPFLLALPWALKRAFETE